VQHKIALLFNQHLHALDINPHQRINSHSACSLHRGQRC
jgi:hypothetical protein